jgi:UDPglucose 6-dehydrogenase
MRVVVVGMSHLGVVYSIGLAERGFEVTGIDSNTSLIHELGSGTVRFYEPGAEVLLKKQLSRSLDFSCDMSRIKGADLVLIAQDTRTDETGNPDYVHVQALVEKSTKEMSKDSILIILSQVYPGFTRKLKLGGRAVYQVETLIFGRAIERVLDPEQIIIGLPQPNFHSPILEKYLSHFSCVTHKITLESAELAKISINIQLTFSILAANLLATSAEISGADWGEVKSILKNDKRIGEFAYLSPNLGLSGDNLPRDLNVLKRIFEETSNIPEIEMLKKAVEYNSVLPYWVNHQIKLLHLDSSLIGIIGLSYKENTQSIKGSPALKIIERLRQKSFICYDPQVKDFKLPKNAIRTKDINEVFERSQLIVITTPWNEFREFFKSNSFLNEFRGTIIDPFEIMPRSLVSHCKVIRRGRSPRMEAN